MKLPKWYLLRQPRLSKADLRNIAAGSSREKYLVASMSLTCSWISAIALHASRNAWQPLFCTTTQSGVLFMITRGTIQREFAEHTKPKSVALRTQPNESPENSLVISGCEELTS